MVKYLKTRFWGKVLTVGKILLYFDTCFSKIRRLWTPLSVNEDVGTTFGSNTLGGTLMVTALKAR